MNRASFAVFSFVVIVTACATAGGGEGAASLSPGEAPAAGAAGADQNRISPPEVQAAGLPNAYELVARLRRPWLRRDPLTGAEVVVYMDEQQIGGAGSLRDIPSVDVGELRFLSHEEAVRRWGTAVQGSVIVIVRRR